MSAVLWIGGEDVDFPNGSAPSLSTSTNFYRSGYAREAIYQAGAPTVSTRGISFPGGAITSCWLHARVYTATLFTSDVFIGLGLNSAGQIAIAVGCSSTAANKLALWKFSGGTWTQLGTEAGTSLANSQNIQLDMQLTSFGATATVNVYLNGGATALISGTFNTTVTGVTNLDCVAFPGNNGTSHYVSEIIVTDTLDTRALSVVTHAPNAVGTDNSWTGTLSPLYTNVNPTTINDANFINNNTAAVDWQGNLIDLPTGTFQCYAARAVMRMAVPAGSTTVGAKLGIKSGGTVNVDAGHTGTPTFQPFDRLMLTNPVTTVAFTMADLNALQIDIQSQ